MSAGLPPGPEGQFLLGSLPDLSADWLGHLTACARRYGDIVWLKMPPPMPPAVLLSDPALVEKVLVTDAALFQKSVLERRAIPVVGQGLFTSEGEAWRRQRRMMQPAFHRAHIARYGDEMVRQAQRTVEKWRDGEVRDLFLDARRMAMRIMARTLFDVDVERDFDEISAALSEAIDAADGWLNAAERLPQFTVTPLARRMRDAVRALEAIAERYIAERRASGSAGRSDLLSLLVDARDEESGAAMNDRQLRDEVMTILVAGAETSALGLGWSLVLLARHPDHTARLREEARAVLGDR